MPMKARLQALWRTLTRHDKREPVAVSVGLAEQGPHQMAVETVEFAPNDPIFTYLQGTGTVVEVDRLNLDSAAAQTLREAGVKIAIPLMSQGELVGLLNLGHRLGEQEYSTDDRRLLRDLVGQAAPAVRVAQLVRQQEAVASDRQRLEQELEVARVIQQTLLPEQVPQLPGWQLNAHYRPARQVGGDYYDFVDLPGGRLGIFIGDGTGKGVPAALVMATARAILRTAAEQLVSPSEVLKRANDLLYPDIPSMMFVTCLYSVLDPDSGRLQYANAGHDLPFHRSGDGIDELWATGMPLGLMPSMTYEEKEIRLLPGESVLFYSDGLVEAHNSEREMFGLPRLRELVAAHPGGADLIDFLLGKLEEFTGAELEQEDDLTFVTLQRLEVTLTDTGPSTQSGQSIAEDSWLILAEFDVQSERGNEREAMERVAVAVQDLNLPGPHLERLKTAVAEATMNAMEHGNQYSSDLPASIKVMASKSALSVSITDHGGGQAIPDPVMPDLDAKLAEEQTPRGWGLFLIQNLVDEMRTTSDEVHHTIELIMYLRDSDDDSETP